MYQNLRKFKNSPNLLLLFVKITKFLEFSKKITIKNYSFFELWLVHRVAVAVDVALGVRQAGIDCRVRTH